MSYFQKICSLYLCHYFEMHSADTTIIYIILLYFILFEVSFNNIESIELISLLTLNSHQRQINIFFISIE
jgi:hypothetical protein